MVEGAALLLSDLGMARVDRSAAWLRGENAEARSTTARSVSLRAPSFPRWKWPSLPSISRPSSVPVKYRGPNAKYPDSCCSIATTTRHIMTLQSDNPFSCCHRSLELPKNQDAHRGEHDFPLCGLFLALTERPTRRMNNHRLRGSHHATISEIHAIRPALCVMFF